MSPGPWSPSVPPRQPRGPVSLSRSSAHPAPDVLTPRRPRHSPRQLHSWLAGLWDSRPANRPGKEGTEGTPQASRANSLSQSTHWAEACASRFVCVCVWGGVYLTPFLPARPQEVPHELVSAIPLPPARCPHSLTVPADSLGWTRRILPCSPENKFTHSLMFMETKRKSGPQGAKVWKFFLLSDLASTLPGSQLSMCYGSC